MVLSGSEWYTGYMDASLLAKATPEELAALENALLGEVGLMSPADWAAVCEPEVFLEPPHVRLLSDHIRKLVDGELLKPHAEGCGSLSEDSEASCPGFPRCEGGMPFKRLLVTMPPRHGKSEMISRYTPAWFISRNPKNKVILASYEAEFAAEWGGKVRDLLLEHGKTFNVHLNPMTKARDSWRTQNGGGMQTAGSKGAITGKGAHLFIIDDPFKNDEEANSETIRNKVWGMYQSTAFTRLEPNACIILVHTRWHEDDLAGRCLRDQADQWIHIDFPAVAEEEDVLGRVPGQPLWPYRYDADALQVIREAVGSYVWNALYQQRPYIEGGGILKPDACQRFTIKGPNFITGDGYRIVPRSNTWRFITIDTAGTSKNYSDFSVAAVFDVTPDKEALLVHIDRRKIDSAAQIGWLQGLFDEWRPRFVGIENKTFGTTLIQTALRLGLRVQALKADTDKVTRAYGLSPFMENGKFQLPHAAPWLADLEHEMASFPYGTHDDQVDAVSYAARVLQDHTVAERHKPKKPDQTPIQRHLDQVFKKKKRKPQHPILGSF